jgi:hypothetical protein
MKTLGADGACQSRFRVWRLGFGKVCFGFSKRRKLGGTCKTQNPKPEPKAQNLNEEREYRAQDDEHVATCYVCREV